MRAVGEKDRTVERRREQNEAEGTQTDRIRHTAEVLCVCLCVSRRERESVLCFYGCVVARVVYHVVSASLYIYYFHVWARLKMATCDKPLHLCHVCMSSVLRADNGKRQRRSVCQPAGESPLSSLCSLSLVSRSSHVSLSSLRRRRSSNASAPSVLRSSLSSHRR